MSTPSPVPTFAPRAGPGDFFQGLSLVLRAWRLIFRTPRLRTLSALGALLTLVVLGALIVLSWTFTPWLLGEFWTRPTAWFALALWQLVRGLLFLVLLVIGANVVVPLVLAPLQDPLSERTEELCGGFTPEPFEPGAFLRGLLTGLGHTLARLLVLLLGLGVLAPLNFLPGVGSVAWGVTSWLWTALWLAGEHLAAPMTRHLYPFAQVRQTLRQRWLLCLGFGTGVALLFWLPLFNSFFLPVAVVGGTLLYRGLLAAGSVPPPPIRK
jgi:CysZ protein